MTISPDNLLSAKKIQLNKPVMSCMDAMIWFNKSAAKIIGAPCKVKFTDFENGSWSIVKDKEGFSITQRSDRFTITHNGRILISKLEEIFNKSKPKFLIIDSGNPNIFELKLIES